MEKYKQFICCLHKSLFIQDTRLNYDPKGEICSKRIYLLYGSNKKRSIWKTAALTCMNAYYDIMTAIWRLSDWAVIDLIIWVETIIFRNIVNSVTQRACRGLDSFKSSVTWRLKGLWDILVHLKHLFKRQNCLHAKTWQHLITSGLLN